MRRRELILLALGLVPSEIKRMQCRGISISIAIFSLLIGARAAEPVDFSHQIVPILRQHCAECHTGDKKKGGFSMNTRASFIAGGQDGKTVEIGNAATSKLIERVLSTDPNAQMPPKGPRLSAEKVAVLKAWIDGGLLWDEGFAFKKQAYEPPLKPRRPELPPAVDGRTNPIDRILDAYLAQHKLPRPEPVGDAEFTRRVSLDLVGLLPPIPLTPNLSPPRGEGNRRAAFVRELLANDTAYAEHWLTFWNDLLRNDYVGTGYIDGGRKQISKWLYKALLDNMPYDQFARELIAPPTAESAGFAGGIKWRGNVSAGQAVELQFAQSISQTFLGLNMKCASCHDSFIDRWKLEAAYGLAAIYASGPLQIHRCDKPTGKTAAAAWLFPELGQVDAKKPQPERLKELAALMTHPDNGRFTRTIVNRLWHRLMGRGIVHPTDAMQSEPWNADLLDFLATDLADHKYDLKHTLELIVTSQAYQSKAQSVGKDTDEKGYVYAGPRAKRMSAEQFVDAIWQISGSAPPKFDAPITRKNRDRKGAADLAPVELKGKWVWSYPEASDNVPKAGETITLRKQFELKVAPKRVESVITADNSYVLYVNGQQILSGDNWETPGEASFQLKAGKNEIVIVAKNGGTAPNPAAVFFEARMTLADGSVQTLATDETWQWTSAQPENKGHFKKEPTDWKAAVPVKNPAVWASVGAQLGGLLSSSGSASSLMVRASLMKCDLLMRALGRPNREQIVSVRPSELSTLEAIDLANTQALADMLAKGAKKLMREEPQADALIKRLYASALCRMPTNDELAAARGALGSPVTEQGVQDLMWVIFMMPEFQMVR